MKVLSIGTDRKIFEKGSAVALRVAEQGALFEEIHVVVFSLRHLGLRAGQIASNVWVYPTNSISRLFYIKDAKKISKRIILERKLGGNDVVTCQDPFETGLAGLNLKKVFGIPLHIQVHTDIFNKYFIGESFLNKLRAMISKRVFAGADAVRVVSKRIADSLVSKNILKTPPVILPIFVDIEKIKNTEVLQDFDLKKKYPQFNFVILMASRLTKEKNISLALGVLKEIIKKYPMVGLVVVGSGPCLNDLKNTVHQDGLGKNVIFEGWNEDLSSYYKTADLFLLTSNYEGYGMTIVEALGAHCPVVSTDVGIASDVLRDGEVFVCPVGDARCLFEKIKKFIENSGLREAFTHEAFARLSGVTCPLKEDYLQKYKDSLELAIK
ncbi:MAG: glycosyltransferase family 4 protein [Candidatus Paceibacterota bacterium]